MKVKNSFRDKASRREGEEEGEGEGEEEWEDCC